MSKKKPSRKAAKAKKPKPAPKAPRKPAKKAAPESSGMAPLGTFHWTELQTSDPEAAKAFYTTIFGWKTEPFGEGMDYTVVMAGGKGFGGIMKSPMPGAPPQWIAYLHVKDVDAIVAKVKELGGKVCTPPFEISGVGRLAILQDPQGAVFAVHAPKM